MSYSLIVLGPNQHFYVMIALWDSDIKDDAISSLFVTYQDVLSYAYKQEFKIKKKDNHIAVETSAIRETIKD